MIKLVLSFQFRWLSFDFKLFCLLNPNTKPSIMYSSKQVRLSDFTVKDLTVDKLRLIEVRDSATLADALNAMVMKHMVKSYY